MNYGIVSLLLALTTGIFGCTKEKMVRHDRPGVTAVTHNCAIPPKGVEDFIAWGRTLSDGKTGESGERKRARVVNGVCVYEWESEAKFGNPIYTTPIQSYTYPSYYPSYTPSYYQYGR